MWDLGNILRKTIKIVLEKKMSNISATAVKELREKTGAGMLDCKNALVESEGDLEKAVEFLRKKGIASAEKKSSRLASEGLIHLFSEGGKASIVEVNCETDFVAKNEAFQDFIQDLAKHVYENEPQDLESLLKQSIEGKDIETLQKEMVAKIGENINIRRFELVKAEVGELLGDYTHMGSRIGVIVKAKADRSKVDPEVLKGIAMHIAAVSPRFVDQSEISADVKAKEKEIFLAQMQDSGKPAEMLEKIIEGKLQKFAKEVSLVDQIFVKDPEGKKTVAAYLKSFDPEAKILSFVRFQVGEGLEKKQENFAEEVAKQISK